MDKWEAVHYCEVFAGRFNAEKCECVIAPHQGRSPPTIRNKGLSFPEKRVSCADPYAKDQPYNRHMDPGPSVMSLHQMTVGVELAARRIGALALICGWLRFAHVSPQ